MTETQKAEEIPSKYEVICPLAFKLTKDAIRYDLGFLTTKELKEGEPGCWRHAPQMTLTPEAKEAIKTGAKKYSDLTEDDIKDKEDGKGKSARPYALAWYQTLEKLQDAGSVSWKERAFFFTHEQGVKARKSYEQLVLEGGIKANKTSWTGKPDEKKFGFAHYCGISFEQLEKGEVPEAARPMRVMEWYKKSSNAEDTQWSDTTLGDYLRQLYQKATSTYESKEKKRIRIAQTMEQMNIDMVHFIERLPELAEEVNLPEDEIKILILGNVEELSQQMQESHEPETVTEDEVDEPTAEELQDVEPVPEEELVAGVQILEPAAADDLITIIKVPSDAVKERVAVHSEAVAVNDDGDEQTHHWVDIPSMDISMFLRDGFNYKIRAWPIDEKEPEDVEVLQVIIDDDDATVYPDE